MHEQFVHVMSAPMALTCVHPCVCVAASCPSTHPYAYAGGTRCCAQQPWRYETLTMYDASYDYTQCTAANIDCPNAL